MSTIIVYPKIKPRAPAEEVVFSLPEKKWHCLPCYWSPDAVQPQRFERHRQSAPRRRDFLKILTLDETTKKIWWRCLRRTRPKVAKALMDQECRDILKAFDGSIVIEYD